MVSVVGSACVVVWCRVTPAACVLVPVVVGSVVVSV